MKLTKLSQDIEESFPEEIQIFRKFYFEEIQKTPLGATQGH